MLIAPASANTLSKMSQATCDNLLLAVYLSAKCPVYFAPAMEYAMHEHAATQESCQYLMCRYNIHIPAPDGDMASGLQWFGRMQDPDQIVDFIEKDLAAKMPLMGQKILITAGPTYEPIDPVRYIGNHSSGKMGYAIANEAASRGAEVVLVSGPSDEIPIHPAIKLVRANTTDEMLEACLQDFNDCNILVMAAAVADFKPKNLMKNKIKKSEKTLSVELVKTVDNLSKLANSVADEQAVARAKQKGYDEQQKVGSKQFLGKDD